MELVDLLIRTLSFVFDFGGSLVICIHEFFLYFVYFCNRMVLKKVFAVQFFINNFKDLISYAAIQIPCILLRVYNFVSNRGVGELTLTSQQLVLISHLCSAEFDRSFSFGLNKNRIC